MEELLQKKSKGKRLPEEVDEDTFIAKNSKKMRPTTTSCSLSSQPTVANVPTTPVRPATPRQGSLPSPRTPTSHSAMSSSTVQRTPVPGCQPSLANLPALGTPRPRRIAELSEKQIPDAPAKLFVTPQKQPMLDVSRGTPTDTEELLEEVFCNSSKTIVF